MSDNRINEIKNLEKYDISALRTIMEILRSDEGCPWDREQTHTSIRQSFIEETYEAVDAIDNADTSLLLEELGDVLLQVVFHARIEEETGSFGLDDVIDGISRKLVSRHPHVFGEMHADTSGEVLGIWEAAKKEEKKERRTATDAMLAVPRSLPALMRAQKIGGRAAKVGFDFESALDAMTKIVEETEEVREVLNSDCDKNKLEDELGDLLFAVVNTARLAGIDSEIALSRATDKFTARFSDVEQLAENEGKMLKNMTNDELNALWDAAKVKNHQFFKNI